MVTAAMTNAGPEYSGAKDYSAARRFMVDGQIRTNKVTDERLIEALADLPREKFARGAAQARAYIDDDLPLGGGRYMMEPMVLARLMQTVQVQDGDRVLVVGANTGYGAALAARMGGVVTALESDAGLADAARTTLAGLSLPVAVVTGALGEGYSASGPYKAIIIEGAVEEIPTRLIQQLSEGGRLVTVLRDGQGGVGRAVLLTRTGGGNAGDAVAAQRVLFDANTAMLPGFERARNFAF